MGVKRAIKIAQETAHGRVPDEKVTIFNEIVHNDAVMERLRRKGVNQASSVDEIDEGILIISAHGIPPDIIRVAQAKGLKVVDATCPLVSRIYAIIHRAVDHGYRIVHVGELYHEETIGILGQAPDMITVVANQKELQSLPDWKDRKLGLTVQTTAHAEMFNKLKVLAKNKWPRIEIFNTICNATTQRQTAIRELIPDVDMILVVGSRSSANSNRLASIAQDVCGKAFLIGSYKDIKRDWFESGREIINVGLSAGASTPQFLVEEVIQHLLEISNGNAEVIRPYHGKSTMTKNSRT